MKNATRGTIPRLPFAKMKQAVLGHGYDLSVAFVTPKDARALSKKHKHKDHEANVLSFRLSKTSGEIILCPSVARREAKSFARDYPGMLAFLFIHGLLHLKGHTHGGTMEREERRLTRMFT